MQPRQHRRKHRVPHLSASSLLLLLPYSFSAKVSSNEQNCHSSINNRPVLLVISPWLASWFRRISYLSAAILMHTHIWPSIEVPVLVTVYVCVFVFPNAPLPFAASVRQAVSGRAAPIQSLRSGASPAWHFIESEIQHYFMQHSLFLPAVEQFVQHWTVVRVAHWHWRWPSPSSTLLAGGVVFRSALVTFSFLCDSPVLYKETACAPADSWIDSVARQCELGLKTVPIERLCFNQKFALLPFSQ